jgi:CBS-domain-containing membrane protein
MVMKRVWDFMTSSLKTASVGDGIYDVIEMMKEAGVPYMPIVDKKGKVISLVSQRDLYSLLSDELNTLSTTLVKTSIQLRSHRPDKSDKSNKAA